MARFHKNIIAHIEKVIEDANIPDMVETLADIKENGYSAFNYSNQDLFGLIRSIDVNMYCLNDFIKGLLHVHRQNLFSLYCLSKSELERDFDVNPYAIIKFLKCNTEYIGSFAKIYPMTVLKYRDDFYTCDKRDLFLSYV